MSTKGKEHLRAFTNKEQKAVLASLLGEGWSLEPKGGKSPSYRLVSPDGEVKVTVHSTTKGRGAARKLERLARQWEKGEVRRWYE